MIRIGECETKVRPGFVTLVPPGIETEYEFVERSSHLCAHFSFDMNADDCESILRSEFEGLENSAFLLQLRINLTWDVAAFSRLITAMEACALAHEEASTLPRWIAEGFWYYGYFVREWFRMN